MKRAFSTSSAFKTNIPPQIWELTKRKLHKNPQHPLATLINKTQNFFDAGPSELKIPGEKFKLFQDFDPLVTTHDCFDQLFIPKDHISRAFTDTYYHQQDQILRTHTSVHQIPLMKEGNNAFLCVGDVYRKDTVDKTHYPVFHQMEGVRIFDFKDVDAQNVEQAKEVAARDLKQVLENLAQEIFGDVEMKWSVDHFPFTDPSYELEVYYNNEWLEILGCGVILDGVMLNAERDITKQAGWAFGLGLERWAMKLFEIDDIRQFWSEDPRFINQFKAGQISKFKPYSKYPTCYKDISFWVNEGFSENDFFELVRGVSGDLAESALVIDDFVHPKTKRRSLCFRINYRHMDRSLTNEEIDIYQFKLRDLITQELDCELR